MQVNNLIYLGVPAYLAQKKSLLQKKVPSETKVKHGKTI